MNLARFLIVVASLYFAFVFQTSGVLTLGSLRPNLVLVFFLLLMSTAAMTKEGRFFAVLAGIVFLGLIFWFFSFWFWESFVLFLLSLSIFYARRFLTGEHLTDFLLMTAGVTLIFYLVLGVTGLGGISGPMFFGEVLYNFVLGLPLWYFFREKHEALGY